VTQVRDNGFAHLLRQGVYGFPAFASHFEGSGDPVHVIKIKAPDFARSQAQPCEQEQDRKIA
jgi:hypothetical protein